MQRGQFRVSGVEDLNSSARCSGGHSLVQPMTCDTVRKANRSESRADRSPAYDQAGRLPVSVFSENLKEVWRRRLKGPSVS
jgi:hypothetical protein